MSLAPRIRPHGDQRIQTITNMPSGICGRLSHWLWPNGWVSSCETPTAPPPPPPPTRQPYDDCKACREWKVDCDHAKPQCSHCCQEQLLCFYVDPTAKPKIKRKNKPRPDVPTLKPIVLPAKPSTTKQNTT